MRKIIFVAPLFRMATRRFLECVSRIEGIRLGVISQAPIEHAPDSLRSRFHAHYRIGNCGDPGQLAVAARALGGQLGGIDRIFTALEELQEPLGRVRDYLGIPGMSAATAANFRDKSLMKQILRQHGVPCAKANLVHNPSEAARFAAQTGFPLVVKPPAGAGARGTFQIKDEQALRDYLGAFAPSPARPALFEEFVKGEEHSFEAVSIAGQVVWSSLTRYYPNPLQVLENPWIQWCVLLPKEIDHPRWNPIRQANRAALRALGMGTGLTHMEWFLRADGSVAISEVGARPPGAQIMSLMSYATDKDFYRAWAELIALDHFDPPERKYAAGAAYLRGKGKGKIKAVLGLDEAQKKVSGVVVETRLPKPGQLAASGYEGDGYVIVRHPETERVKQALHALVTTIKVVYE